MSSNSSISDHIKPDISDLLNEAIMHNSSKIIVEGKDDIQFYTDLAQSINKNTEVWAVENISGYSEGCSSVIDVIEELAAIPDVEENYLLGIIDRDSRSYRQEMPSGLDNLLLVLKFYSYESHFFSKNTITKVINLLTYADYNLLENNKCIDLIESKINDKIDNLYYCSLEALKNACEPNYQGIVGYGTEFGQIFNKENLLLPEVLKKKLDLDEYASQLGISKIDTDIKKIAKGKLLLHWFAQELLTELDSLPSFCKIKHDSINQCQYCKYKNEENENCLYKQKKPKYDAQRLKCLIVGFYHEPSLDYIKARINLLH
jgi:hypothetical protein